MTIFCSTSYRGQEKYQREFELLLDTLAEFKHVTIISPYLKNTYQPLLEETLKRRKTNSRFEEYQVMRRGIRLADAVIFETSHESFQIGYEVNYALVLKKPTLCLSTHEDFSTRIQHDYFFGNHYTEKTLRAKVQDFLSAAQDMTQSQRFNLFLYPHQIDHLQLEGQKHGMNMSEYVRFLINQDRSK
jgi:hypothetical protein